MNRMRYPEEKLTLRFTLAFLLGFFAALLVSWCGREYYLQKAGLISDFYLRRLKYKNLEGRRLFGSFLGKRMKWAALFPGILLLGAAEPVMLLAGGWLGFAFGVVVSLFRAEIRLFRPRSGASSHDSPGAFLCGRGSCHVSGAGGLEVEFC